VIDGLFGIFGDVRLLKSLGFEVELIGALWTSELPVVVDIHVNNAK
jgi:hypothetical protein